MTNAPQRGRRGWQRYIFYEKTCRKTTWLFRVAVLVGPLLLLAVTRGFWTPSVARGLICDGQVTAADAILVENFDPTYLLFERASELRRSGMAARVIVPTPASSDPLQPNLVSAGIVDVMAGVAQLREPEIVPIQEIEPISLNAAYQIRHFLQQEKIGSIIVVTSALRSRRSALVYGAVLGEAGIRVSCLPVFGLQTPETWTHSWHGALQVAEQYLKLEYYRFYILPSRSGRRAH